MPSCKALEFTLSHDETLKKKRTASADFFRNLNTREIIIIITTYMENLGANSTD